MTGTPETTGRPQRATDQPDTPLHLRKEIRSTDHNEGMELVSGTVVRWAEVSAHLCRVTIAAPTVARDPVWATPNVAVRLRIGSGPDQVSRIYTVRSCSTAEATIDVDVVRHGHPSPMMTWLADLAVGRPIEFVGPRPHMQIPELRGRPAALFADDTAVPALFTLLQQPPAGLRGVGWVATDDAAAYAELPQVPGLDLHRIEPGRGYGSALATLDDPAGYVVWGAGERDEMRAVRSFFRSGHGVAKSDVAVFGYWKRGTSNTRIDEVRLTAYQQLLARGGTVAELEDLDLDV